MEGAIMNNLVKSGIRVLFVDDEKDVTISAARLLVAMGCEVKTAISVDDALSKIANTDNVVITDICMNGCSGIILCQKLKEKGYKAKIIAFSGDAFSGKDYYLNIGFDYFVLTN